MRPGFRHSIEDVPERLTFQNIVLIGEFNVR